MIVEIKQSHPVSPMRFPHQVLILFGILSLTLGACSTIQSIYTDVPKEVATMEAALATAEHTALIYVSLPVCGKTSALACRTPAVTAQIGAADMAAYTAIQAARTAETQDAVDAAQTALTAYQTITNGLSIGGK